MIDTSRHPKQTIKRAATLAAVSLAAVPVVATAAEDTSPPLAGGVKCDYSVKEKFSARTTLRSGMPVRVTCSGPAEVGAGATLWGFKAREYKARRFGGGSPGDALVAQLRRVGAGTTTIVLKVRPWARGLFRRFAKYAPMSAHTYVASKRVDGRYWAFNNKNTRFTR